MINSVIHGDCLEVMKSIPDKSIDMILCDLPYGTTACKWDAIIPFEPLWEQYKRIIKDNGVIVLTASQPFTSALVMSNLKMFKYEWIWEKSMHGNFALANYAPLRKHENILIFSKAAASYVKNGKSIAFNKQMTNGLPYVKNNTEHRYIVPSCLRVGSYPTDVTNKGTRNPTSIIKISNSNHGSIHPTQKPVALFEYLIKTYTNENMTVLDNCAGSGTTAIACLNTSRNYILIEKEKKYIDIINKRIEQHLQLMKLAM